MNCKGIFGRLFGHNYQPVFDTTPPERLGSFEGTAEGIRGMIDAMSTKKHVHTICTRCGDVIEARLP